MTDHMFDGCVGKYKNSIRNLMWGEYETKTWTEDDVDIKSSTIPSLQILLTFAAHCEICSSDLHILRLGWGPRIIPLSSVMKRRESG